jgi:thioesterase domain-containing protein
LGDDQPLYGLQPPGLDGDSAPLERVEDLAAYFAAQIRALHPDGPCIVAGYCAGGMIAFELGRQLRREGRAIPLLALFGAPYPSRFRRLPMLRERLEERAARVVRHTRALASLRIDEWPAYIAERRRNRAAQRAARLAAALDPGLVLRGKVERATVTAGRHYTPGRFDGRVCLFVPSKDWVRVVDEPLRWRSVAQVTEEYFGPAGCDFNNMLLEPHVATFADFFRSATGSAAPMIDDPARVLQGTSR